MTSAAGAEHFEETHGIEETKALTRPGEICLYRHLSADTVFNDDRRTCVDIRRRKEKITDVQNADVDLTEELYGESLTSTLKNAGLSSNKELKRY